MVGSGFLEIELPQSRLVNHRSIPRHRANHPGKTIRSNLFTSSNLTPLFHNFFTLLPRSSINRGGSLWSFLENTAVYRVAWRKFSFFFFSMTIEKACFESWNSQFVVTRRIFIGLRFFFPKTHRLNPIGAFLHPGWIIEWAWGQWLSLLGTRATFVPCTRLSFIKSLRALIIGFEIYPNSLFLSFTGAKVLFIIHNNERESSRIDISSAAQRRKTPGMFFFKYRSTREVKKSDGMSRPFSTRICDLRVNTRTRSVVPKWH